MIGDFLLANWKLLAIIALATACGGLINLWLSERDDFADYRAKATAAGEAAKEAKVKTEIKQEKTRKEVNDEWKARVPELQSAAVREYIAHYGNPRPQPAPRCVLPRTSGSQLPGTPQDTQGPSREEPQQLPTGEPASCEPPSEFIAACAEDALARQLTARWAEKNGIIAE